MLNAAVMYVVSIQLPVIIRVIVPNTKIPVILQVALLTRLLNLVSNFHPYLCAQFTNSLNKSISYIATTRSGRPFSRVTENLQSS